MCLKNLCVGTVTNTGFNAVLGSLMLLTSSSCTTRPHYVDHSVPNHSILVQNVVFHSNIPFVALHAIPFCFLVVVVVFFFNPNFPFQLNQLI